MSERAKSQRITRKHTPAPQLTSFRDMAPVLKVYEKEVSTSEKRKGKRKVDDLDEDGQEGVSNRSLKKKNKQRVLLLSSRGITHRMRHFMNDLEALLPHVKKGVCVFIRGVHIFYR